MNIYHSMNSSFYSADHNRFYNSQESVSNSITESLGLFEIMKNESNRSNSFNGKWPLDSISTNDLARSGFFYLLSDDKVQCAFCKLILAKWEVGDKPLDQHQKFSPMCCFLLNSEKTAEPKKTIETSKFNYIYSPLFNPKPQKSKVPRMSDVRKRLSSYKGWSVTMISIEDLAVCGLFYSGVEDVVTCFSCGISFGDWEPNDEPMTKHSKLYPNCIFLHFVISSSCLERRKTRKTINTSPELISKRPPKPSSADILQSEIVHGAKEIFPSQLVEEVVSSLKETGEGFSSLLYLCDKVLEYEEKKLRIRLHTTPRKSEESSVSYSSEVPTKTSYNDLKSTKKAFLCKICWTEEMGITFQPCGHLISCESCSRQVSKCPICRMPVQKRIKTYLS